jgi:hypothetical protein
MGRRVIDRAAFDVSGDDGGGKSQVAYGVLAACAGRTILRDRGM